MIKAVIFDLDDTLYPEKEYVFSGFKEAAAAFEKKYRVRDVFKTLAQLFLQSRENVFDRLFDFYQIPCIAEDVKKLVSDYQSHIPQIKPFNDAMPCIHALQKKFRLGIITDGREIQQNRKIDALKIRALFDRIIITDCLGGIAFRKPNPKAFELMQESFDCGMSEIVYIGDNPQKDFYIKKTYPIKTIQVLRADAVYCNFPYKENVLPEYILHDLSELSRLIDKI